MKIFLYQRGKYFSTIPGRYMGICKYNSKHSSAQYWVHVPGALPPVTIWKLEEPLCWSGRSGHDKIPTPAAH
jgi:hypothetical protein